jgi:hypothetical protein
MVAGGAVTLDGAALFLVGHARNASAEHVSVIPTASRSSVGFALTGSF